MHEEFECLLDGIQREDEDVNRRRLGVIDAAMIDSLRLTVGVGGHGKAQFAAQTQYLISRCEDVELVICAGAAGALVPDLSFGDIVISTSIIEHDYKERFDPEPPPVHRGHQDTWTECDSLPTVVSFFSAFTLDSIASGDEDIVDRDRADQLHTETRGFVCCVGRKWWRSRGSPQQQTVRRNPSDHRLI